MDYVMLSLQHDTYLDSDGPFYAWTEVEGTGNFVHRTLLVDSSIVKEEGTFQLVRYESDKQGCDDEVVVVTASGAQHFWIARASAMRSPLLRMLIERDCELKVPALTDYELRTCLDVLFGEDMTETQLSKNVVQIFFLDKAPLNWIPEVPADGDVVTLAQYHGADDLAFFAPYRDPVPSRTMESSEWERRRREAYALYLSYIWYSTARSYNMLLHARCGVNVSRLLSILLDNTTPHEELSRLSIESLSHSETKLIPFIEETLLERPLRDAIRDKVVVHIKSDTMSVAMHWFLWGYSNAGWRRRTRLHANGNLVPLWDPFVAAMKAEGMGALVGPLVTMRL